MKKFMLGCVCGALYTFPQFTNNDGECTWCDTDTDMFLLLNSRENDENTIPKPDKLPTRISKNRPDAK